MRPDVAPPAALGLGFSGWKTPPVRHSTSQVTGQQEAVPYGAGARHAARCLHGSSCWAGLSSFSGPSLLPAPMGLASTRHGTTPMGFTGLTGGPRRPQAQGDSSIPLWGPGGWVETKRSDGPTSSPVPPHGSSASRNVGVTMNDDDRETSTHTGTLWEARGWALLPTAGGPGAAGLQSHFPGRQSSGGARSRQVCEGPALADPLAAAQPGHTPGRGSRSDLAIPRQNV